LLAAALLLELGLAPEPELEPVGVDEPPTTVVGVVLVAPTVDLRVVALAIGELVGATILELAELEIVLDAILIWGVRVEFATDVTAVTVEAEALELAVAVADEDPDEEETPVIWNG